MLEVLLLMLYASIIGYAAGVTTILFIMKLTGEHEPWHLRSPLVVIIGFAVISCIVSLLHFIIPIDWRCHVIVWIFITASLTACQKQMISVLPDLMYRIRKSIWFNLLLLLTAIISVAIKPGSGDIADYHLQAIKWSEYYKLLPGIGNFNRPLVNNNWWFHLQAFFGLRNMGVQSVYVLNGVWYVLLMIYFSRNVFETKQRLFRVPVILFLLLTVKTAFIGSVTPDIVITGIIFLCFDLFLESRQSNASKGFYSLIISLLIFWGITIKATALLLVFLIIILLWYLRSSKQVWLYVSIIAVFGCIWLLPWLAGNVVRGGFLLYPFNQIDVFQVDWKVPASYFEYDKIVLKGWGRIPYSNIYETAQLSYEQWVPVWFNQLDLFNKGMVLAFVASLLSLLIISIKQKSFPIQTLAALAGWFMLFNSGPHMRFMYGYMVVMMGIALSQYTLPAFNMARKAYMGVVALMLCWLIWHNQDKITLIKPLRYPQHTLTQSQINQFPVFVVQSNNLCWDQFPCTYYIADKIMLRTSDINDGFKVAQ